MRNSILLIVHRFLHQFQTGGPPFRCHCFICFAFNLAIENFEDGSPLNRALWVNGEKEGKEIRFYKNGKKYREKNYVDGKLQGTMTIYYENGSKKSVYFFEHGILQGVAFRYLEDGKVVEDIWEDGKKISSTFSRSRQNSLFPKNFTTPTTGDAANTVKGD